MAAHSAHSLPAAVGDKAMHLLTGLAAKDNGCHNTPMRGKRGGVVPYMKQGLTCLIMVLFSFLLSLTAYAEHVQIVTFHYPPVMDSNKPQGGLIGEIVHAAFREVDIETDLVYYPAKRMLLELIGTEKYLACIGPIALIDRQPEDRKHQVIRVPPCCGQVKTDTMF